MKDNCRQNCLFLSPKPCNYGGTFVRIGKLMGELLSAPLQIVVKLLSKIPVPAEWNSQQKQYMGPIWVSTCIWVPDGRNKLFNLVVAHKMTMIERIL